MSLNPVAVKLVDLAVPQRQTDDEEIQTERRQWTDQLQFGCCVLYDYRQRIPRPAGDSRRSVLQTLNRPVNE
jgi:hypothetical protein